MAFCLMRTLKSLFTLLLLSLVLVAGIWFSIRNPQSVSLDLIAFQLPPMSLALLLIAMLLLGTVLGAILMLPWIAKLKKRSHKIERAQKRQHEELHQLRTLNLKDSTAFKDHATTQNRHHLKDTSG